MSDAQVELEPIVEEHRMPNGSVIYFRGKDHAYWEAYDADGNKCKGRIAAVSTVSKNDGNTFSDPLINWGVKLDREGIAREASLGLAQDNAADILGALNWLRSPETITKTLEQEKATWEDIRNEKGNIGWQAHDVLERLCKGETPRPGTPYDEAVLAWWDERQPEPLESEQVVYSAKHSFAGRFDLRCEVGTMPEDKFTSTVDGAAAYEQQRVMSSQVWLLDAKSSNYIGNAFAIQLNLYNLAAIECGIGGADYLMILKVKDDGTWQEIPIPVNPQWALDALAVYRNGKQISQAIRHGMKTGETYGVGWPD